MTQRRYHRITLAVLMLFTGFLFLNTASVSFAEEDSSDAPTSSACKTVQFGSFFKDAGYAVAQQEGFFNKEGLCVNYNQVTSSTQQFNDFLAGKYDIISTALDNVANRIVNQNLPIEMITAVDRGADFVLAINTANGIHSIADLRGKAIAVDAPNSGFVFALRKILAANGLFLENGDYSFQIIGGTAARFKDIELGQTQTGDPTPGVPVYATMLVYPFTARISGPVSIAARFSDYVAPFQNNGLAVTHTYADNNGTTLSTFLRAYIEADRFLFDPNNHAKVVADFVAVYGVTNAVAEADYAAAVNTVSGQNVDAQMDKQGMINVINLRTEFNGFNQPVDAKKFVKPATHGFYDDTFWKAAERSLNQEQDDNSNDDSGNQD